MLKKLSVVP